jgi:hypothetical protein
MGGCFEERSLVEKLSGRLKECRRFATDTVQEGNSKKQKRLEAKD